MAKDRDMVNKLGDMVAEWRDIVDDLHCTPSPLDKQFCVANTAMFTSYITFQSNHRKYFSQGKCELMNFLFVLLDKLKI